MGVTANRLGYPDAAEELIRAGWAYANAIDHRPAAGACCARSSPPSCTGAAGSGESRRPGRRWPASTLSRADWVPSCTLTTPAQRPGWAIRTRPPGGRPRARCPRTRLQRRPGWRSAASSPVQLATHHAPGRRGARRDRGRRARRGQPNSNAPSACMTQARTRRAALVRRQGAGRHRPGRRLGCGPARWTPPQRRWSRSCPCRPAQRIRTSIRPLASGPARTRRAGLPRLAQARDLGRADRGVRPRGRHRRAAQPPGLMAAAARRRPSRARQPAGTPLVRHAVRAAAGSCAGRVLRPTPA